MSYKSILVKNVPTEELDEISNNDKSVNYITETSTMDTDFLNKKVEKKYVNKNKVNVLNRKFKVKNNDKGNNNYQKNNEKFKALLEAQNKLIKLCKPSKDDADEINLAIRHINNWSGKNIIIDCSNDLLVKINEMKYSFSKSKFFKNKKFRDKLMKEYSKNFNCDVWVKIFKKDKKDDNNEYVININKKH